MIEKIISVREDFFLEESKKEKYLVILTKEGKIKRLPVEKIGRVLASGKRVINIAKYQDQVSQVTFTSGADDLIVFTRGGRSKSFAEEKVRVCGRAAYGDTAIKLERSGGKTRCQKHQKLLADHKTAACCDKSQGVKAYSQCSKFRELFKDMKTCAECNQVVPTDKEKIKDEMVSLEVIEKEQNKGKLCLLAIKEDDSGVKKPLLSVFKLAKRRGGAGQKSFKIEEKQVSLYCAKHENAIAKIEEKRENISEKVKDTQRKIEELKKILNKVQEEKVNPEVVKKYEQELTEARQVSKE
jgi:DNA gyrase/topoisomerase IV subunit A